MKRLAIIAVFAVFLFGNVSCEKSSESYIDYEEILNAGDRMSKDDNPYKSLELSTKSADFLKKGNAFTFELIDRINKGSKEDFIISPLSVQFLLGMVLDGAQGKTADEICNVLGYGSGEVDSVNEYCLSMLKQLPTLDKQTTLSIANAIVVNQKYSLHDAYKTTVSKFYEAEVSNMDFTDRLGTADKINEWCSDQTNGLIPEIIKEVNPDMLVYLMNAVYFNGEWAKICKFQKENTSTEPFTLENGEKKNVQMMKNNIELYSLGNDVFTAVRIPYGNGAFNMMIILPDEGHTLQDVTESLKGQILKDFIIKKYKVDLWLPKFETKFSIRLNDMLSAMGMPSAFNEHTADFKAMTDTDIFLSYVKQDAFIKVDENGTEAAAVTSAGGLTTSLPAGPIAFHADRPFLYLIVESNTSVVLFAGKYSGK